MTDGATTKAVPIPTQQMRRDLDAVRAPLESWLRAHVQNGAGLAVRKIELPEGAGVANETLLVDTIRSEAGKTREEGFVVRVGPSEQHLYLDADVSIAYRMYKVLEHEPDIPSPPLVGFEGDPSLFGQPFFVMRRVDGRVPSDNPSFYDAEWFVRLSERDRRQMWRNSIELIGKLNRLDPSKFAFLDRPQLGANGVQQELRHWLRYVEWCDGGRYPIVRKVGQWLVDNLPRNAPPGLSWGDARPQNIILQGVQPVALLDWDTVSLVGSESDIAWWMLMTPMPAGARRPGWGSGRDALALWQEVIGRPAENLDWYLVFNSFRLRVIMVRLATLLHAAGSINAEQKSQIADRGEMEAVASLLERKPERYESAWTGWDQ